MEKETKCLKNLLLYSTGLDSELYRLLEKPEGLLFFTSGARYEAQEMKQLYRMMESGLLKDHVIKIDNTLNFKSIEEDNAIVPMRNIFYFLRAFQYCNVVLLGVTYYDLHFDKQPDVLNALTSFVQNYYYFRDIPDTWNTVHPIIEVPYRGLTKGELLSEAIDIGCDVDHIPTLRTCYDADSHKGCGKCKSCVQKAIALAVNDMFKPELFDNDPRVEGKDWYEFYQDYCEGTIDPDVFKGELEILLGK